MKALFSILFTFLLFPAFATNYYVSNSGSNTNNGTSTATPWQTIAKVNATSFVAGDSVLFKRGDEWREMLVIPTSGSAGNPIVFGAYGTGALPIINGSDAGTNYVRTNAIYLLGKSYIVIQDFELKGADVDILKVSGYSTPVSGVTIQRIVAHDNNPADRSAQSIYGNGILVNGVSDLFILNCTVYNCQWNGISVTDGNSQATSNVTIEDNHSYSNNHNGFDTKCALTQNFTNISYRRNTSNNNYGGGASGFYVQALNGGYVNMTYENNLAYNNALHGIAIDWTGGTIPTNVKIYNNTLTSNGQLSYGSGILVSMSNSFIKNNILFNNNVAGLSTRELQLMNGTGTVSDYNLIYKEGAVDLIKWGANFRTYAQFKSLDGQEAHGLNVNPLLKSTTDFHLQDGSPCIDAGTNVGLTYTRTAPDMGAFESVPTGLIIRGHRIRILSN